MKTTRKNHSADISSITDRYEIDLSDKSDVQNKLTSVMPQCKSVAITIETRGATGISGNFEAKQSMNKNSPAFDLPESPVTAVAAADANEAFEQLTLTMECIQVILPSALPNAGKIIVTIVGKR